MHGRGIPRDDRVSDNDEGEMEPPRKVLKVHNHDDNASVLRRSARNKGKVTNYANDGENVIAAARTLPQVVSARTRRMGMKDSPRDVMMRKHDPYGFPSRVSIAF